MKELFKHCSYVEERNGLYIPRRYTDTPVWRTEFSNGSKLGEKRLAYAQMVRDQMFAAGAKFGFRVHDGLAFSPNARALLADHCHPNDQGFTIYAQNLLPILKDKE